MIRPQSDEEADGFEIVPQHDNGSDTEMWDADRENGDEHMAQVESMFFSYFLTCLRTEQVTEYGLSTAEAVTLAQQLANRQTTKTHLINDGFTRYSLNSKDDLPAWFLDDESKYYKPNLPVTKEAVVALRARQRALDARPIKKIAEAKGRKKMRAARRLEKAMKKAESVNATSDMTESEKAKQIEALMKKGASIAKRKETKVVVAKGGYKGIKGRPKGVKGRYTMVDARMKKEVCMNLIPVTIFNSLLIG